MELLFKNKTILSKKNYMNLVKFHQKKNNWKYWLYTAIFSLLFIFCFSFQISAKNYLISILVLLAFICFISYRFIYPYYKTNKELKSDKIQKNLTNFYMFYDKYFKVKNEIASSKHKYNKLYKVYENKDYFYLYLDKSNAFIVEKSGFMIGNSKDFQKFIKNKTHFKFELDLN